MSLRSRQFLAFGALVILSAISLLSITACDEFFPSENALDHINVTPASVFLKIADTQQLSAQGVNGNGGTSDVTSTATWTTSDNSIASVSTGGLVTANLAGTATITASADNTTATSKITVNASTLTSIAISSSAQTVPVGSTLQLTATGTFQDGNTLDVTQLVAWTTGNSGQATVDATGLVKGVAAGNVTITATATTKTAAVTQNTQITVQ